MFFFLSLDTFPNISCLIHFLSQTFCHLYFLAWEFLVLLFSRTASYKYLSLMLLQVGLVILSFVSYDSLVISNSFFFKMVPSYNSRRCRYVINRNYSSLTKISWWRCHSSIKIENTFEACRNFGHVLWERVQSICTRSTWFIHPPIWKTDGNNFIFLSHCFASPYFYLSHSCTCNFWCSFSIVFEIIYS